MNKPIFKGSCPALVTPFNDKGIDYAEFEKHIEFQIQNKSDALLVCGTTGEPSTMTLKEKQEAISFVVKQVNGRVPVVAGTGGNCTAQVIEDSVFAEKVGADALLVVTPYYNKCTQNGLVAHYNQVADKVGVPIIVYNVPGRTGVNISASTLAKMAEHKNISAVKEASGNIDQIVEIAALTKGSIDIYSGDDAIVVPVLSVGGIGVISVGANIAPKHFHDMVWHYLNGETKLAAQLQTQLYPLIKTLFLEVNPIPVKTAAALMGFGNGMLRMPLTAMETANREKMVAAMQNLGIL